MEELNFNYIDDVNEIKKYWWLHDSFWRSVFFDEMYYTEPITIEGNKATWYGSACNAYESLKKAGMTEGYECGCKALRNGVMKGLGLKPLHTIEESLVNGAGRCVITFEFEPRR